MRNAASMQWPQRERKLKDQYALSQPITCQADAHEFEYAFTNTSSNDSTLSKELKNSIKILSRPSSSLVIGQIAFLLFWSII